MTNVGDGGDAGWSCNPKHHRPTFLKPQPQMSVSSQVATGKVHSTCSVTYSHDEFTRAMCRYRTIYISMYIQCMYICMCINTYCMHVHSVCAGLLPIMKTCVHVRVALHRVADWHGCTLRPFVRSTYNMLAMISSMWPLILVRAAGFVRKVVRKKGRRGGEKRKETLKRKETKSKWKAPFSSQSNQSRDCIRH